MTINRQGIIAIVFSTLLFSCGQKSGSSTTFSDDKLLDNYSLKIPTVLHKDSERKWATSESNSDLLLLEINTSLMGDKSLQEHLDALVNEDTREVYQDKSFVSKDSLSFNGFTGIAAYYEKDNSKGVIPVVSYYTFAILQDGNDIIKISSISLGKDYTEDIKTTIKSIKTIKNDSLKTSSNVESKKGISKEELKKLKQDGFQIFEKDNFLITCNCKLKQNTLAIKMAKEQGVKYPFSSYVCSENKNSYETGVICNINVTDMTSDYSSIPESKYSYFTNKYLKSYIGSLEANNISYTEGEFNGVKTVEYTFSQMELPTKAVIFVKDKKSYLLQIGTRKNLSKKFSDLKTSFKFIN